MSYETGWAAVNLEMPDRIPHIECSAPIYHLELVSAITGMKITNDTPWPERLEAMRKFMEITDADIHLNTLIGGNVLSKKMTSMGHAAYAVGGTDFNDNVGCPFKTPQEALAFDPWETYGPIDHADYVGQFSDHYANACNDLPTVVNMTGIYSTLMSGMIYVFGWDMLLLAAGTDQDGFGEVCNRYASWMQQFYDAFAESDVPVLYSHDDLVWTEGAFIHPDWYRKYIFPNIKKMWEPCVAAGKKILFICDGDYTAFLDDVVDCGASGFYFESHTDLKTVVEKFGQTHIILGNGDCRPLTFGTKADVRTEVERCMNLGRDCPGYFMCMADFPANVPLDNALYYYDVYEELCRR